MASHIWNTHGIYWISEARGIRLCLWKKL